MMEPYCCVCGQTIPLDHAMLYNATTGDAAHMHCETALKERNEETKLS